MKYYDNSGGKHGNIFAAMVKNISNKADTFIMNKMPGYEETINEDEHLYDAMPVRFDEYPPAIEPEVKTIIVHGTGIGDVPISSVIIDPSPSVHDLLKMDHEEPIPSLQKINIDYAHGVINLHDENGEIIASSPIDERLSKGTIDKALLDVLYPNGVVPDHITTNVQSKGYIPGHASKTYHPDNITSTESDGNMSVTQESENGPSCG